MLFNSLRPLLVEFRRRPDARSAADRERRPALTKGLRRQDGRAAERRPVERDARGVAPDDRVQADHRLEADAEARLDEDYLVLRVAGAFGLEQILERPALRSS